MLAPNGPTYVVNVGTEWAYARACHPKARACRGVSVPLPRLLSRQHCSVRRSQDLAGAMKRVIRPNTVICTAAFLLASCGGNDPTGPGLGLFTAAVDGDVDVSLSGDAVFFEGGSIIWMLDGNFNGHHDFLRLDRDPSAGPPGVGTFTIAGATAGPDDFVAEYVHARVGSDGIETTTYRSLSGSLITTSVTADRIVGSFNFKGIGPGIGTIVEVQGTFTAKPGPF